MSQENSKPETVAELEAKLKAIKQVGYAADLDLIAKQVRERAVYYDLSPRKLLEDLGKTFQTKRFVRLNQTEDVKETTNQ